MRRVVSPSQRPPSWAPAQRDREHLLAFEGYGVDDPDIVFVGLEEYCDSDPAKQRENIRRRCISPAYAETRADKNAALRALAGLVKTNVPVWDMMARIVGSLTGRSWATEREALGARPSIHRPTTLLTELRALPRPGTGFKWQDSYLQEWFSAEFRNKSDFERRCETISGLRVLRMLEQKDGPTIVFFYGLPARTWADVQLQSVLQTKFEDGEQCATAWTTNGTLLVSTGFYDGQHAESAFREEHVPALAATIRRLLGDETLLSLRQPRRTSRR